MDARHGIDHHPPPAAPLQSQAGGAADQATGGGSGSETCRAEPPLVPLLFRLHHIMMRVGDRLTREHRLSSSRWMLLCVLGRHDEPMTVGEVSDDLLLSAQNVSRMAAVLESEGLLERSNRPGRGRTTYLSLTQRGRGARSLLDELGGSFVERMLAGLDEQRIERLEGDLSRLIDNVRAYESELIAGAEPVPAHGPAHETAQESVDEPDHGPEKEQRE